MENFDVIVIGSGPGGYVTAVRSAQLGLKTACIEKDRVGGICLNWGCIPTKALLKSAEIMQNIKHASNYGINPKETEVDFPKIIKRSRSVADRLSKGVEMLFKKNNITKIQGKAFLKSNNIIEITNESETKEISAKNIIIATGGKPRMIPGVTFDGVKIISSSEAMILEQPPKTMAIIGAGPIGIEFAYFYNTFGTKVTVIEMMPHILPFEDAEVSDLLEKSLKKGGIKILNNARVQSVSIKDDLVNIEVQTAQGTQNIEADITLAAIGVQGNSEGIGLENTGVEINKSFIKTDKNYKTNIDGIYAIGDVIGPPLLAHKASAEGINCIEKIAGLNPGDVDYSSIPGCTFCSPQVGSIGLNEDKAKEQGIEYRVGKFPYSASGKAIALAETEGFVKLLFDNNTDKLIGGSIIGAEASELLAELSLAKAKGLTAKDIIKTVHSHPTLSEMIMESAAIIHSEAIHA
jgi:dihydrolipoamide dehydrogenase